MAQQVEQTTKGGNVIILRGACVCTWFGNTCTNRETGREGPNCTEQLDSFVCVVNVLKL